MDYEHRSGEKASQPTIHAVVTRLQSIRNHPIARRKRSYLEPLVEIILDERVSESTAKKEEAPGAAPSETVVPAKAGEGQPTVTSTQDNTETSTAMDLSSTAVETEAARPEGSLRRARKHLHKGEGASERTTNGRRIRKRRRVRSESDSGSEYEHGERKDGGEGSGKLVVPTRIPPNGPQISDISGMNDVLRKLLLAVWYPLRDGGSDARPVLLYGPSGCGKTLMANAVAAETGANFFSVSGPAVIGGVSGESESNIRSIFDTAIKMAPSLIFIDAIEAIAGKHDESTKGAMENRMALTLSSCIDRLEWETDNGKNVVVLAATNDADNLNPVVRQRFDTEVVVSVPSQAAREAILQTMTHKIALADDVDLKEIARLTPGFVGRDLMNVVKMAKQLEVERAIDAKLAQLRVAASAAVDGADVGGDSSSSFDEFSLLRALIGSNDSSEGEPAAAAAATAMVSSFPVHARSFQEATQQVVPAAKREGFSTVPDTTWEQVGAMKAVREQLKTSIIWPIQYPDKFAEAGLQTAGGILLWGPPGCGKTLVAKAVANESKANFISVRGPELLNKYVGESERALRQLFERARAMTPCVIFFDEMDALAAKRDDGRSDGSARIVNTLLTELDGLVDRSGIYVIGATNRPDMIDPAFKRPGRLGEVIFVGPPTAEDRVSILQTLCRNATRSLGEAAEAAEAAMAHADNMQLLADVANDRRCDGFSGADLDHLRRNATIWRLKRSSLNDTVITREDWEEALQDMEPSISPEALARYEKLR